ncbi:chitin synthase 2 [Geranomyces variabilis]|nr:chitin synthase 2 [Geranomyces variabilis]KAJ3139600.1 Chitin synthase, class 1 [Geranomyces variabilis]
MSGYSRPVDSFRPGRPPHHPFQESADPRASFVSVQSYQGDDDIADDEELENTRYDDRASDTMSVVTLDQQQHQQQQQHFPPPPTRKVEFPVPQSASSSAAYYDHGHSRDDTYMAPIHGSEGLRSRTTISRRTKTVKLSPHGNFCISQRVPEEARARGAKEKGEEFESMRYTAATCDPDDFIAKGYNLRCANYGRKIEIFVVVTMYNEDAEGFNRTMFALAENIKYLCEKKKAGWDEHAWEKVAIVIVADGRSKIHPNVLKVLEVMGVYQEGLTQSGVNGLDTTAHIFEYTPQTVLDAKMQLWGAREGMPPMQVIFCLKEKNLKKINSHRWFFRAFAASVDPRVTVLIDVGTKPSPNSLYSLWKAFYRNEQIGGCCGEICADLGEGLTHTKNILNPVVASQNFEYKISNIMDKSLESSFGYISVLPGAFSAYRWVALQDLGPGSGPLSKYFDGELRDGVARDSSIFSANLYLAEDRILCFELIAKPNANWTLHYVPSAKAYTDVPDSIPEFLSQRRRWLNGSLFAGFYALANINRVWKSKHSFLRKCALNIQWLYNILNQLFSWFVLGNFAITFFFLFAELEQLLVDPTSPTASSSSRIVSVILNIARFSYPVVLVCLFIISFGNRPQAFARTYKAVMFGFGVIGAVMIGLLIRRLISTINFLTTKPKTTYANMMNGLLAPSQQPTADGAQILLNAIMNQMGTVMLKQLDLQLNEARRENLIYCVTLASTVGVYFIASFLQFDFAHMFTCFVQYLVLLPSYINVLTVYALSNLHDVSWGTKGDTRPTSLPTVQSTAKSSDGIPIAEVQISSSKTELSSHYLEALTDLRQIAPNSERPAATAADQEDSYKSFRTAMMLLYLGTNSVLFAVGTTQASGSGYITILLAATALLSVIKLLGVIYFLLARAVARARWSFTARKLTRAAGARQEMSQADDAPFLDVRIDDYKGSGKRA